MTEILSFNASEMPSTLENINSKEAFTNASENVSDDEVNHFDKFGFSDDSDSARTSLKKKKKRTNQLSESESDVDKENTDENGKSLINNNVSSDSDDYTNLIKQRSKKSRIKNVSDDSESGPESANAEKRQLSMAREDVPSRITEKRNKLREKFQNLLSSKDKNEECPDIQKPTDNVSIGENGSDSSNDEEINSINEIRKKIKEHSNALKMSICDPDTSEDESSHLRHAEKPKKQQRRMKLTSPKPQRMSAKQAMENMQKIKSESNRMLREKDVSLPYHRPKALSLKDIMSRRKPAMSSDGKALPIKMNEEQLRQYALQLEQRQKEIMELCKSDSEEEEENETTDDNMTKISSPINTQSNNKDCEMISENIVSSNLCNTEINSEICPSTIITDISHETEESIENKSHSTVVVPESNNSVIDNINTDIANVQDKSDDVSAEMELLYNDSVEEDNDKIGAETKSDDRNECVKSIEEEENEDKSVDNIKHAAVDNLELNSVDKAGSENCTEKDSQLISLHYDTEKVDSEVLETKQMDISSDNGKILDEKVVNIDMVEGDEFSDSDNDLDDINIEDIDAIIENAEILQDKKFSSPALLKDTVSLRSKPKLTGAPGMVIDLGGNDAVLPKKLTGVELLKERFTYFARLKTPEEMEREKEKRQKPGAQHLKLKQELEEKIAEQRSLEWAKRLESEKEQQKEMDAIRGDSSDVDDDIDAIEAKLEETGNVIKESSSSEDEEELIEDDMLIEDKPREKNPLLEDEAEESDVDEDADSYGVGGNEADVDEESEAPNDEVNNESDENSSDEDESSESEDENETKPKKGRILKAFEDSDDEETAQQKNTYIAKSGEQTVTDNIISPIDKTDDIQMHDKHNDVAVSEVIEKVNNADVAKLRKSNSISESQDDDLQLAQVPKHNSEDLFTSQETVVNNICNDKNTKAVDDSNEEDLGSQTFSIMTSCKDIKSGLDIELESQEKLSIIAETQSFDDKIDAVAGMCSGSFSQNYIEFKPPSTQSQNMASQPIGEDILDMCTGKFYDNEFVSQNDDNMSNVSIDISQDCTSETVKDAKENSHIKDKDVDILKSVLDELNEPEFEKSKPMKYFFDGKSQNKENVNSTQMKKKFVIDSDDDASENLVDSDNKKKKKLKKKKLEKRALQISDDEDEEISEQEEFDDNMLENGDAENEAAKLVEYDSEENEIEVKQQPKKKRKVADFFEQEAELTSEDEWAGSGDEDEAGLDRMEREEGDDDTFHQGRLQAELGQIHMRDVLDQDKREVRLIQELLFEDGDLGGGGRQRKFRWRNADGEEVMGTVPDELADTQEEEFESEEQWRKQRHEREIFLRQLKSQDDGKDDLNVSVTRSTIIKANLLSRTMSSVLEEVNNKTVAETTTLPVLPEKKVTKDIPSPKKPFLVFQQSYHGSLLTRGRGALARLAALATPLAVDDDGAKVPLVATTSKRNFVFAAITPEDKEPKVTKRKAETNMGTPRLVKKMRTEDKKPKTSLLDHLKA